MLNIVVQPKKEELKITISFSLELREYSNLEEIHNDFNFLKNFVFLINKTGLLNIDLENIKILNTLNVVHYEYFTGENKFQYDHLLSIISELISSQYPINVSIHT